MKVNFGTESKEENEAKLPPPWIGVDLDKTLAHYDKFVSWDHIGDPIPDMVAKVKEWLEKGIVVKILTARLSFVSRSLSGVSYEDMAAVIKKWCKKHIGTELEVTSEKDCFMLGFCDDSAVQIDPNTGKPLAKNGYEFLDKRIKELEEKEEVYK